jgi:hypothetical protein
MSNFTLQPLSSPKITPISIGFGRLEEQTNLLLLPEFEARIVQAVA